MKSFIRIIRLISNYWSDAMMNVVFNLLAIVFSLVSLTMIIPFLRLLFGKEQLLIEKPEFVFSVSGIIDTFNFYLSQFIVHYGKTEALAFICVMVIIVFMIKNFFRYLAVYALAPIRAGIVRDIRSNVFKKTLELPLGYFARERKGDLIARMTTDVQEIEFSIISVLEVTFREPVTIIAYLLAMLFMSPGLTAFVLIMLPLTGLIIGKIGKSLKKVSAQGQAKLGYLLSIIDETLTGLRIIKAFNAENYQTKKFVKENDQLFRLMNGMNRKRELSSPLSEFLGITVVVVVLWFGGRLVLNENSRLAAETFIAFIVIFSQLIPPAKSFASAFYNIQKGIASAERIEKVLDAEITVKEKLNPLPIKSFNKEIEYRNVGFSYEKEMVLDKLNFKIAKGKMIALVGQSGGGKSTLADLLPRFYDPVAGEILIDGINIKEYNLYDLRNLLGIVTQESILFNDTVYNNIAFGTENATEEDVIAAAKIANAHDFVQQMENGYQTFIGDRGGKLSGGQRQRLSIARAILANPPILILDEATSALDSESEKLVQDALYKLMKNRTSIVIAHRLSTIQFADEIIVLQNGKIMEQGNHIGLSAKNGIYKKLVDLQAF